MGDDCGKRYVKMSLDMVAYEIDSTGKWRCNQIER